MNQLKRFLLVSIFFASIHSFAGNNDEVLKYVLRYGFVVGGEATFSSTEAIMNNQKSIHYIMKGNTIGLTHAVFAVNDVYESWVDPTTYLPLKAIRNVKEKDYKDYEEVLFYHKKDSAFSSKSGWAVIPDDVCDIVSALFHLRKVGKLDNLKKGSIIEVPVWHENDQLDLEVKYLGIETIKTKVGKFECIHLQPTVESGKLFKRADGLSLWVTNDANKIPLLLQFDLVVGSLKCELIEYTGNDLKLKR